MFNIVERRQWYFLLSAVFIIPGLVAMIYSIIMFGSPVKLSIDFTGGALLELRFDETVQPAEVRQLFAENGFVGSRRLGPDTHQTDGPGGQNRDYGRIGRGIRPCGGTAIRVGRAGSWR